MSRLLTSLMLDFNYYNRMALSCLSRIETCRDYRLLNKLKQQYMEATKHAKHCAEMIVFIESHRKD
jgi:hypothetical protein